MTCHECNTDLTTLPDSNLLICEKCNVVNFPDESVGDEHLKASGRKTDFLCPCCPDQNLEVGDLFGTQVCFCEKCNGFVIDRMSLGELIDQLRAAYDGPDDAPLQINAAELHEIRKCPACYEQMETFSYYGPGNVVLDTCDECKLTWFNHGELGKIIRAPGKRSLPGPYNRESQFLRKKLYAQAEQDLAAGVWLLLR